MHICNLAAQSGVTRFTQLNKSWAYVDFTAIISRLNQLHRIKVSFFSIFNLQICRYSKEENLKITDQKLLQFSHLLVEQKGKYFYENENIRNTHEVLDTINCFNNIGVEYRSVFPIKIKTRPCIILLRRKKDISLNSVDAAADDIRYKSELEEAIDSLVNESEANDLDDIEKVSESNDEVLDDVDEISNPSDALNDEEHNNRVEMDSNKPTTETKQKLRTLIERHYRSKAIKTQSNDRTDIITASKPSTKSNIKQIIQKEKIKDLIEKIAHIDLRAVCDLENESTKNCLLKIIDSYME